MEIAVCFNGNRAVMAYPDGQGGYRSLFSTTRGNQDKARLMELTYILWRMSSAQEVTRVWVKETFEGGPDLPYEEIMGEGPEVYQKATEDMATLMGA